MPKKKEIKRYPLNMRTTKRIREKLESAAESSGRSLAQEVEYRLELSFKTQDLLHDVLTLAYGERLANLLTQIGNDNKHITDAEHTLSEMNAFIADDRQLQELKESARDLASKIEKEMPGFKYRSIRLTLNDLSEHFGQDFIDVVRQAFSLEPVQ
jgi:hypothetical protein